MAARAIDPMQLQLFLESGSRHEPLQFRHPHLGHVFENHVLAHHFDRGVDFGARKSQALHDLFSHFRTEAVVPAKANSPRFIHGCVARFADS